MPLPPDAREETRDASAATAQLGGTGGGVGDPHTAHVSPEQDVMPLDVQRGWAVGLWGLRELIRGHFSAAWEVFSPYGPHGQSDRKSSVRSPLQLSVEQGCDEREGEGGEGSGTGSGRNA